MNTVPQNELLRRVAVHKSATDSPSSPQRPGAVFSWQATLPPPAPISNQSSTTPSNTKSPRLRWTDDMEDALVAALLHQMHLGNRSESGYKKSAWQYVCEKVQSVAPQQSITVDKCKNKTDSFKKDWKIWTDLMSQPNVSMTPGGIVSSDPRALDVYFTHHRDAQRFITRPLKFEKEFQHLFASQDDASAEDIAAGDQEADEPVAVDEGQDDAAPGTDNNSASRKRSGTTSNTNHRSGKKKSTSSDRIAHRIDEFTTQLKQLTDKIGTKLDYQFEAIRNFTTTFSILEMELQLAVIEVVFSHEFSAKTYILLKPDVRKKWVQRQLYKNRDQIFERGDYDVSPFDSVMNAFEWSGDGDLERKAHSGVEAAYLGASTKYRRVESEFLWKRTVHAPPGFYCRFENGASSGQERGFLTGIEQASYGPGGVTVDGLNDRIAWCALRCAPAGVTSRQSRT
ncbi:hypothetical protein BDW02DRAFT_644209 [Decorospora gaudefroyi]|uniref:Myb/SANT-like domain-containing protein n=1 Tax=Decorospora gaudefroyi TaxID=184978 RepID=A0A6A5KSG2_9PLEO|nr:hypothetical protein BDW02DRAFT_644209 [Decorospora gaudefroyi]